MLILNEGTNKEVGLRVSLESDIYGCEYFDSFETLDEMLRAVHQLTADCAEVSGEDGVERMVAISFLPQK